MRMWLMVLVAVIALGVTAQSQATPSDTEAANSALDQSVAQVDSVLQQGLSSGTYERVTAETGESAAWFKDFGIGLGASVVE